MLTDRKWNDNTSAVNAANCKTPYLEQCPVCKRCWNNALSKRNASNAITSPHSRQIDERNCMRAGSLACRIVPIWSAQNMQHESAITCFANLSFHEDVQSKHSETNKNSNLILHPIVSKRKGSNTGRSKFTDLRRSVWHRPVFCTRAVSCISNCIQTAKRR